MNYDHYEPLPQETESEVNSPVAQRFLRTISRIFAHSRGEDIKARNLLVDMLQKGEVGIIGIDLQKYPHYEALHRSASYSNHAPMINPYETTPNLEGKLLLRLGVPGISTDPKSIISPEVPGTRRTANFGYLSEVGIIRWINFHVTQTDPLTGEVSFFPLEKEIIRISMEGHSAAFQNPRHFDNDGNVIHIQPDRLSKVLLLTASRFSEKITGVDLR